MLDDIDLEELKLKFEPEVFRCLDIENVSNIIIFLKKQNIDYIDEIINDYLHLFLLDCEEFKTRFLKLKDKYDDIALAIAEDMSILDDF